MLAGLLSVLREFLFHLVLELFGFALQHFLLPLLLGGLLTVALLLGEIFLAVREFVELLESIGEVLRLLLLSRSGGVLGFVLVLFGVELEIEESREIARGAAASARCQFRSKGTGRITNRRRSW